MTILDKIKPLLTDRCASGLCRLIGYVRSIIGYLTLAAKPRKVLGALKGVEVHHLCQVIYWTYIQGSYLKVTVYISAIHIIPPSAQTVVVQLVNCVIIPRVRNSTGNYNELNFGNNNVGWGNKNVHIWAPWKPTIFK